MSLSTSQLGALPFRTKLSLLTAATVAFALFVACLGLFALQYRTEQRLADQRQAQLASVIANHVGPAVLFDDRAVAFETLSSAQNIEEVLSVQVVLKSGEVFSEYRRPFPDGAPDLENSALLETDIEVDGEVLGALRMRLSNRGFLDIIAETWGAIVGLFLICLVLATLVSRTLNQMAFRPIQRLVHAMRAIEVSGNFAMRLPQEADRDFALIPASFNAMLAEIERGNDTLKANADQLREVRDEAEEANTAKSEFLANMSHELRTPLNAILGYAEVLREEFEASGSQQSLEDIEWIHTSAQQLLGLINGILDLSKIEAGKMELDCHDFDVGDLITEVAKMIEPMAANKDNTVTVHVARDLAKARTDSVKLRQALLNLGSNACKFTEGGQVMITARGCGEDVVITVSDTGIGMDEDALEKLFQPFSQADTSTTRRFGGTGLGLTITQRFIELMGGRIEVESSVGAGSSFTITVPLRATAASADLDDAAALAQRFVTAQTSLAPGDRTKPLALVIDDEPSSVQLITRIAEQSGYDIITARDGHSGLALMREAAPNLVLLDLSMPRCDGWEVLAKAESEPDLSNIPVVVVSVSDEDRKTHGAGASDHLTKPVSSQQIREVLEQYAQPKSGGVLLVENDRATAALYARGLKQMGYDVSVAYSGAEAVGRLDADRFDTVVTDLDMAGFSGFELVERIAQIEREKRPSIYVLTGLPLEDAQTRQLDEHVVRIFTKNGLSPRRLATAIGEAIPSHTPSSKVA